MKTAIQFTFFVIVASTGTRLVAFETPNSDISLAGQTVTVIIWEAKLTSDGKVVDRPDLGESLQIEKDEGVKLWVKARNAYIERSDVVLYKDAIDYFTRRIEMSPTSRDFNNRAYCWHKRGADDLALSDFNEALRLNPTSSAIYLNRSMAWEAKSEPEKALADLSQAILLEPNDAIAYVHRGTIWGRMQQFDKAIADFNEAIRLEPTNARAYEHRGHAWRDKNDDVKAMADIDKSIQLDPNFAGAYAGRANYWIKKGEHEKAISDSNRAIRLDPNRGSHYATRARAFAAKGDVDKALADLSEAIRLDPPAGYNELAWVRATDPSPKIRDGKDAVRAATHACELTDWKNDSYIDTLSAALAESGRFDEAIQRLQQAIDMNPGNGKEMRKKMMVAFKSHMPYRVATVGR